MSNARAARKREIREEKKKKVTYNLSASEIEAMKKKSLIEGTDYAFMLFLAIPLKVMHDVYGWSEEDDLPGFCEALTDEYQNLVDNDYDISEYVNYVEEVTGGRFIKDV